MSDDERGDIRRLLDIMARLRDRETGCPWDVAQDFSTIAPYTIEEAYEVADAIDRGDLPALKDELGDLLLQVAFHARMAEEQGAFSFGDVVGAICDKMVRRHPHVFQNRGQSRLSAGGPANGPASGGKADSDPGFDAGAQTASWEAIKRAEREAAGERDASALAGVSRGLPEWQRAVKLQDRAARVGFDWPGPQPVIDKLHEEIDEVRVEFDAVAADPDDAGARARLQDELGDLLFVAANLARHAKVDVGAALRGANHKFERRFRRMEVLAAVDGLRLQDLPLEAQDAYWVRAKRGE